MLEGIYDQKECEYDIPPRRSILKAVCPSNGTSWPVVPEKAVCIWRWAGVLEAGREIENGVGFLFACNAIWATRFEVS